MTPNDIASSVSGLKPVGEGSITTSTRGTTSYVGTTLSIDDSYTWD